MLKTTLLIFSFFLISINSFALGPDVGVGLKTGVNFNKINAAGFNGSYNTNLLLGVYSYANLKKWGLQYEVIFSNAKAVTDTSFKNIYKQYLQNAYDSLKNGKFGIPQMQVPILVNYKFKKRIWLQGGVMYTSNICVIDKNSFIQTNKNIFANNDVSIVVGTYIKLALHFNAQIRFVKGITNLNELSNANTWKNNNIQVSFGYKL